MQKEPTLSVITCSIDLRFLPEEVERGLNLLLSSVGFIESKIDCQSCSVARDTLDKTKIRYKETWASEAAFQRHAQSEEFRRVLFAMDMCSEEPEVVIGELAEHSGLTYLHQLCDRHAAGEPSGIDKTTENNLTKREE